MDENQNELSQVADSDVNEHMGIDPVASEDSVNSEERESTDKDGYTDAVRKRIHAQAKKHHREMRAMQEQIAQMQAHMENGNMNHQFSNETVNPYNSPGQPNPPTGSDEERIQKAVRYALEAKDAEARKAKEAERMAHVHKQYQRLQDEFDQASDKYDDFDDVVRGHDVPFSPAIRDALLFIDNPADVAYKLGKNRSELERISQLHPLDQAREVNKLAFALMGGNSGNKNSAVSRGANPLNPTKPNPANSTAITDKTPASVIRARMKSGTWK